MEKIRGNEWKPVNDDYSIEPTPGSDLYTSIDVNIQDVAESALLHQLKEQKAQKGCVVLMEVKTGFVKAIANLSYDEKTDTYFETQNHAIGLASEPGSTFKLASLLVAIEQGKLKISDSVEMLGRYQFYDKSLTDGGKVYGKNTIKNAFEKSSNVISQLIYDNYKNDPQSFIDGLKAVGIHRKLGVVILGEGEPLIKDASDPTFTGITLPWMSIGYELEITPLQTLALYNAVANDGVLLKPQFVKFIKKGSEVQAHFDPEILNPSICSNSTLLDLKEMLEGVVERGTAKNIKARGFSIAGKTGTSKIAQGSKGYGNKYQASFCGYFPSKDPLYSCIVVVQGPTKNIFGSVVSGTVFKEIADKVYANEFSKENRKIDYKRLNFPFSRSGDKVAFQEAAKQMNIPVDNRSTDKSFWVTTRTSLEAIKIYNKKTIKGLVPNVIGMGLIDAAYLLEKCGLFVQPVGSGIVRDQSISPGLKIIKGQKIILQLG
jgi:cell division protein FtsI (penicillin-binding protein 3)